METAIDSSLLKYKALHFVTQSSLFVFIEANFSSVKAQGTTKTMCVGSMAAAVRGQDLSNRTLVGDPETPSESSLAALLYYNDFASTELHLPDQVCQFNHSSL